MNVFERRSGVIGMTAVSDLVNGWPGGIIQAGRHALFVTPIYLVNRLYATHLGTERLKSRVEGPTHSTSHEGTTVPVVDIVASRSEDGRSVFIKAVNTDLEHPLAAQVAITGASIAPAASVERVMADSLDVSNSFTTPDAVRTRKADVTAGNRFTLELPPHSVSVITLAIAK